MPTNREYLDQLASESPEKLKAWFDAEHVDETACVTKTPDLLDVEGVDSREKLEADVREWVDDIGWLSDKETQVADFIAWLDRQAAITEQQTERKWCCYEGSVQAEMDRLQRRIDELCTSYDKLKRERDNLADDLLTCNREREQLRKHLGIALDHAHDICALVDIGE